MKRVVLEVDRLWDGRPLPGAETARVELLDAGSSLRVLVAAPYWADAPPGAPPGPTEGLWEHEVVELFLVGADGPDGAPRYLEVELGPHGHHLVLRFEGVRQAVQRALPLTHEAFIRGGHWRGSALIPRSYLPPGPYRAAAFALRGEGRRRRFCASVALPGPKPDFHQPHRFPVLALPGNG